MNQDTTIDCDLAALRGWAIVAVQSADSPKEMWRYQGIRRAIEWVMAIESGEDPFSDDVAERYANVHDAIEEIKQHQDTDEETGLSGVGVQ